MRTLEQISVFLENRTGRLAEITAILTENGIDLKAISIAETSDYGVVRLIADDAEKTVAVLRGNGCLTASNPVVAVAVPDEPGGLNALLQKLSRAKVDIEYMYSVFGRTDGLAYMVFKVDDNERFMRALETEGMRSAGQETLGIG